MRTAGEVVSAAEVSFSDREEASSETSTLWLRASSAGADEPEAEAEPETLACVLLPEAADEEADSPVGVGSAERLGVEARSDTVAVSSQADWTELSAMAFTESLC